MEKEDKSNKKDKVEDEIEDEIDDEDDKEVEDDEDDEEDEDEDELPDLPDKCPICDKVLKNLLLHIKKKESCGSKIDPKLYEHWKRQQNKYSKKKYQSAYIKKGKHNHAQAKYMETEKYKKARNVYIDAGKHKKAQAKYAQDGKHRKAQAKYEEKFRVICKVCEKIVHKPYTDAEWKSSRILKHLPISLNKGHSWYKRKSECNCPPVDRRSYLQRKRHNQMKYRNRNAIRCGQDKGDRRLKSFRKLCLDSLWCLKRGKIYNADFNKFHLVEAETMLEYEDEDGNIIYDIEDDDFDEIHSWLSEIDGTLLCMVTDFQKVVLAPKSKWIKAIKEVNDNKDKRHLHDRLCRLIGRLQSYDNENTKDISISDEFKVSKAMNDVAWTLPKTLSKGDEKLLVDMLEDLVGEEHFDEELEILLNISGGSDNLDAALHYTKK